MNNERSTKEETEKRVLIVARAILSGFNGGFGLVTTFATNTLGASLIIKLRNMPNLQGN